MFYTNEFKEVAEYVHAYNKIKAMGWEVAFATDRVELARLLAIGFMLVVKPTTYYADYVVCSEELNIDNQVSFEDLVDAIGGIDE